MTGYLDRAIARCRLPITCRYTGEAWLLVATIHGRPAAVWHGRGEEAAATYRALCCEVEKEAVR